MRKVLLTMAMIAGGMFVVACGPGSTVTTLTNVQVSTLQTQADMYRIDQIEVTWHKAASTKNLNLMMTIWAANATFQVGLDTYSGTDQLRSFWNTAAPFQKKNDWVDETPLTRQSSPSAATQERSTSSAISSTSSPISWLPLQPPRLTSLTSTAGGSSPARCRQRPS